MPQYFLHHVGTLEDANARVVEKGRLVQVKIISLVDDDENADTARGGVYSDVHTVLRCIEMYTGCILYTMYTMYSNV